MGDTLAGVRTWSDMIKLQHSVFALPFAVMATFLAGRHIVDRHRPYAGQLLLVIVCMVAARSVAMTFNRIVDAKIDARNPRTRSRPLPAGKLSKRSATLFLFASFVVFAGGCIGFDVVFHNSWPVLLGGPVILYLCGYSYCKRFTKWSHFYLGSAIALSPVAAWVAIDPASVGWTSVVLATTVALWIAGFDIIYSCQDIDVDQCDGLFSLPSRVGPARALMVARGCHVLVVVLLLVLIVVAPFGWLYLVGVGISAVLLFVENRLVRSDDFSAVNLAFFTINGVVSVVLGILAVLDVLLLSPRV